MYGYAINTRKFSAYKHQQKLVLRNVSALHIKRLAYRLRNLKRRNRSRVRQSRRARIRFSARRHLYKRTNRAHNIFIKRSKRLKHRRNAVKSVKRKSKSKPTRKLIRPLRKKRRAARRSMKKSLNIRNYRMSFILKRRAALKLLRGNLITLFSVSGRARR
jgi:hypothetical protein